MEKLQLIFPLRLFTITLKSQLLYHSKFATFYPRVLHTDSGKSWWTSNHHDAMAPFTILSCNKNLFFFWDVTSWTNVIFSKNQILSALWHHSPPSKDLLFRNLKKLPNDILSVITWCKQNAKVIFVDKSKFVFDKKWWRHLSTATFLT